VIILDVDSKDMSVGMSCPPEAFVQPQVLQKISALLKPNGMFVLNLACRSPSLQQKVMEQIQQVHFQHKKR
jgi:spermidine synthase